MCFNFQQQSISESKAKAAAYGADYDESYYEEDADDYYYDQQLSLLMRLARKFGVFDENK